MPFSERRVVIFCKTYPELSSRNTETVCTGALDERSGLPIRLYPVPLRYLGNDQQYRLYDEISVPVAKSSSDPRPESYKVDAPRIQFVSHLDTKQHWRKRKVLVFRDTSWHFTNMEELEAANLATDLSIGMIKPGRVHAVELTEKPAKERDVYERKSAELRAAKESDLFDPIYKELEWLPYHIRLHWSCAKPCTNCAARPHRMKVLDWGLLELGRRDGWDKAVKRLETITDLTAYDFRLYLGNFRLHPRNFGIIGLWFPQIPDQGSLL